MACERTETCQHVYNLVQGGRRRRTRLHRSQDRSHARELGVEIASVRRVGDLRDEWRRNPLVIHIVPVDVGEERVAHDLLGIRWTRAKTLLGLPSQQPLENRDGVARHVNGIQGLVREDGIVDFVFVLAAEGRLLKQHLVDEHTEGPPVNRAAVFLVQQYLHRNQYAWVRTEEITTNLGGHELRSAAECTRGRSVPHLLLAQTIISNLNVSIHGQEDVI